MFPDKQTADYRFSIPLKAGFFCSSFRLQKYFYKKVIFSGTFLESGGLSICSKKKPLSTAPCVFSVGVIMQTDVPRQTDCKLPVFTPPEIRFFLSFFQASKIFL
ncbi:hypothetical protein EOPP23_10070 [Endozoicomonas sp. OPT23]|nr:hypothetical protein [Endozoicomonas sp. OPT23]